MLTYSIYVIDDEESIRKGLKMSLEDIYNIKTFSTGEEGVAAIKNTFPDLLLLDIGLPGINGIEVLKKIKEINSNILVIMITAYEDVNTAVSAMKHGAYDYIVKPINIESLKKVIQNTLETIRLRKEVEFFQEKYLLENVPCFIGKSYTLEDMMAFINQVAKSPDTPILILGETGTGKELIARTIHFKSPNFKGPLVTFNCAAIPSELVESELFGYAKGAFSGARAEGKRGIVEEAAGGTLFLDEIGDLNISSQAKLLRFLEEGEFYRLGETKKSIVKTRVVSATNKDLDSLISKELFRKDLFYRLGVIKVELPSLNKRKDCIIPLVVHFILAFNKKFGKKILSISKEAEKTLLEHIWTGNVRELKNVVERAVLISGGSELLTKNLGLEQSDSTTELKQTENSFPHLTSKGIDFQVMQENQEKYYFEQALKMANGNESQAAKLLKMSHHNFRYRRKKILK